MSATEMPTNNDHAKVIIKHLATKLDNETKQRLAVEKELHQVKTELFRHQRELEAMKNGRVRTAMRTITQPVTTVGGMLLDVAKLWVFILFNCQQVIFGMFKLWLAFCILPFTLPPYIALWTIRSIYRAIKKSNNAASAQTSSFAEVFVDYKREVADPETLETEETPDNIAPEKRDSKMWEQDKEGGKRADSINSDQDLPRRQSIVDRMMALAFHTKEVETPSEDGSMATEKSTPAEATPTKGSENQIDQPERTLSIERSVDEYNAEYQPQGQFDD